MTPPRNGRTAPRQEDGPPKNTNVNGAGLLIFSPAGQVRVFTDDRDAIAVAIQAGLAAGLAAAPPRSNALAFAVKQFATETVAAWRWYGGEDNGWVAARGDHAAMVEYINQANQTAFVEAIAMKGGRN